MVRERARRFGGIDYLGFPMRCRGCTYVASIGDASGVLPASQAVSVHPRLPEQSSSRRRCSHEASGVRAKDEAATRLCRPPRVIPDPQRPRQQSHFTSTTHNCGTRMSHGAQEVAALGVNDDDRTRDDGWVVPLLQRPIIMSVSPRLLDPNFAYLCRGVAQR